MASRAFTSTVEKRRNHILPPVAAGDVVRRGENRYPCYRVIAVNGDEAWVRDVQYGTDHIVPLAGWQKI